VFDKTRKNSDIFNFPKQLDIYTVMLYVIAMKNTKLTISELEKLTGINRRTIHFYTKRKLIPPPEGLGGGARYGEESYLRLLLIKELQKSHLKLSGIKEALDAMAIEEMRSLVDNAKDSDPVWDQEALNSWLQGFFPSELALHEVEPDEGPQVSLSNSFSLLDIGSSHERLRKRKKTKTSYLKKLRRYRKKELPDTTWKRIMIADGIEINVRSDIQNRYGAVISKWIQDFKKNMPKGGH